MREPCVKISSPPKNYASSCGSEDHSRGAQDMDGQAPSAGGQPFGRGWRCPHDSAAAWIERGVERDLRLKRAGRAPSPPSRPAPTRSGRRDRPSFPWPAGLRGRAAEGIGDSYPAENLTVVEIFGIQNVCATAIGCDYNQGVPERD